MSHGKRPAFQFYPKDWLSDPGLRSCSIAARGMWVDLMCVMHAGEPYGHLGLAGGPITDDAAARMVGLPRKAYRGLLAELEAAGVSSRTPDGILFSRRMVKDEHIRQVRANAGSTGGQTTVNRHYLPFPSTGLLEAKLKQTNQQTNQQSVQQMVATATADAEEDGSEGGAGGREARIRHLLPPDARDAFDGMLRAAQNPVALVGELWMIGEGHRVRGATWSHLGAALRDLALSGNGRPSGLALRTFVQKAVEEEGRAESIRLPKAAEDEYTAAIRRAEESARA